MTTKIENALRATGLVVSLFIAGAAFAGTDGDVRSETVKFSDLNLGTDAGVSILYKRIVAAARRVCEQPSQPGLQSSHAVVICEEKAESRAVMNVNSSALSAFYQKKTGQALPLLAKGQ